MGLNLFSCQGFKVLFNHESSMARWELQLLQQPIKIFDMKAKIYHNPRCSKSRQAIEILEEKGVPFDIIEYLKEGLQEEEILGLIEKLGDAAANIVRKKEDEFKAEPFEVEDSREVAKRLSQIPKLLERPIVVMGPKAMIGRPPEDILKLFP